VRSNALSFGVFHEGDLPGACAIKAQYLDDAPFEEWAALRNKHPDLRVARPRDERLIGICYGRPALWALCKNGTVILEGIAVRGEFRGRTD
jgi:hypothetical protein